MGRAALVVSGGILLSRLLGFLRDVVLANILGNTVSGDVYFAAFFIPDLMFYLMAGGYLTVTFIPILSRHLAAGDEDEGWRAFTAVARIVVGGIVVLTLLGMAFAEPLVRLVYVRFPDAFPLAPDFARFGPDDLRQVTNLTRIVLPAQVFFLAGSLLMAVQYTKERFFIPALAPVVYNLGIIAGGVVAWATGDPSPAGFAWGVLAGAGLGSFGLQWYGAKRSGLRWMPRVPLLHPAIREYVMLALPLMLGQSIVVLDEQLARVFGQLAGEGAIASLNYARRLNMLPVGVIAQAAGVAAYPFLARLFAEGRHRQLGEAVSDALRYVLFAAAGATAAIVALSQPAVRVALQRGNFDWDGTVLTATSLVLFAVSIPAWGAQQVYARGFYAQRHMWTPVVIGTLATVAAIPLFLALLDAMGAPGLALASSLAMTAYTVVLAAVWYTRTGLRQLRPVLTALVRSAVAAAVAAAVAWPVARLITGTGELGFLRSLLALLIGGGIVLAAYGGVNAALGSPELRRVTARWKQ